MTDHEAVFVDGVHYRLDKNGDPDLSRPLRWDAARAEYRAALDNEPLHNDVNFERETVLDPGGED